MTQIPAHRLQFQWVIILNGLTIFLWTGIEDNHIRSVALLGIISTVNLVLSWIMRQWGGKQITQRQALAFGGLFGAIIGAGASILTVLLMLLKNARHAHLVPDFSADEMGDMLSFAPVWGFVGGLVGIALAAAWIGLHRSEKPGVYSSGVSPDDTESKR